MLREPGPHRSVPGALSTRTIVLTFDNLGEASELERSTWTGRRPIGQHPSVTNALPRLLQELTDLDLRGTFFVEAINCELNPRAVLSIAERGHELGIHGWRHESWGDLTPGRERELLHRSRQALRKLDLDAPAFRPPGGAITPDTPALLREIGCRWASPLGTIPHVDADGFGWVPFEWEMVDAYHLMDRFASLRGRRGDSEDPLPTSRAAERLQAGLTSHATARSLVLHAFLMADDGWWNEVCKLLHRLAELRDTGQFRIVTGGELIERLAGQG